MANYDMAAYALAFTTNYQELQVLESGTSNVEASYDLQADGQSVSVAVVDDDYVVSYASDFETATNLIDVGNGATLAFNGTTMGGIGIVDLRDMRVGEPCECTYAYDLECSAFRLKYVSGPFALRVFFTNANCLDWAEV
jgi:hypothetical protein